MCIRPLLIAMPALVLLGGCASSTEEYPSLALRDLERVGAVMQAPASQPYEAAAPAPHTLEQVEAVAQLARDAHAAFLDSAPGVTSRVSRASGTTVGSDAWAVAQLELAKLQTHRSQAMIALADLDRIYIETANQGESLTQIGSTRDQVEGLVAEEDRVLDALLVTLPR